MLLEYQIYRMIWKAIDWIFPPQCAGCHVFGSRWCETCQEKTPKVQENQCVHCGRILIKEKSCLYCLDRTTNLNQIYAWGEHDGPLRKALHQLKYRRDLGLGEELANHLVKLIKGKDIGLDAVVPVPLGRNRQRERGYNQSALLARPLAFALGVHYQPRALKRIKDTRTQVGLSIGQRRKNVAGAFEARQNLVVGKKILLVDDVITTGATIDAAGSALKKAGAVEVFGLTLATATKVFT